MDRLEKDLFRENIKIAPMSARIGAYLIDMILLSLVITLFFSQAQQERLVLAKETIENTYSMQNTQIQLNNAADNSKILEDMRKTSKEAFEILLIYMAIYIGLEIVYYFFFVYYYGATLGQIILRIRVVDSHRFDKPSLHISMKRAIIKCIFGAVLYVGFIVAFVDRFYRTLHDKMSNTIVVVA
ncbi:RDD family protein [Helicobacter trogontum]|uniref:RDD family protein n=1 Tax=Helicobacter trogontum TaxID=50960 RepID=A0A4U8TDA6_9HELI|nr:RDD family protein [Helicobacter trogontum]MCI5786502.1 RDD family protein [Helicobacter trogontum]MDY5185108.1 RDD family protein [Helicobacter trogontum]TLD97965.1 RDD family protein [Helicobacter trogontum]